MTIEDKAKLYDEALKKAKDVIEQNPLMEYLKKGIEYILPELKENGDEKIRKWLIDTIKQVPNDSIEWETIGKSSVLAWLEKQGDQDPYNGVSFKYNGHTWGMCARDNGVDILLDRQLFNHLEKKGDQKQDPCEHCDDKRLNCHNFPCIKKRAFKQGKSVFDIINEEKVDNANFHLWTIQDAKDGDVLNSPSHHLIWIYKDNEHYYACVNMNYVTENVATKGSIKIPSDACPATKEQRDLLFQKMHEVGYEWDADKKELKKIEPKFHRGQWIIWQDKCYKVNYNGCGYELIDQNGLSTSLEYGTVDTSARLWDVTKDAKAGDVLVIQETDFTYESIFIFNKIENNHIIQYLHYFITDTDEEVCKVKSVGGFIGDVGDNVHPATKEQRKELEKAMADAGYTFDFEKKELKRIEQKSVEWSEEDENLLKLSLENLTELKDRFDEEYGKVGDCISWLKSLKDRVLPQPKQEWSEEDEQITLSIEQVMNCASLLNIFPEKLNKINKWLKSLKQRIKE